MIYKGQFFPTKKDLKRLVGLFAMRRNFEWMVKRSNKTTLYLVCLIDNCTWKLRAVRRDEGTYFQVKCFVNEHSCPLEEIHRRHRQASVVIIGEVVAPRLLTTRCSSYASQGYNRRYENNVWHPNHVQASVRGFRRCMCPVITVDGIHLKGRFGVTMFVATAQDGNEQVYPICFGERNLDFTSLCSDYYKRQTLIDAYSVPIMPVGHPSS
ncbi:hypothetical protein Dsin_018862 [Dipteronia sinensis]|uniref:Transposase MuDR plant domain-containing protein n=1 Tax=Dipteronia sinensis TaxID=43782 RepID=A0AAE0A696_9ROSI|nr:hypothetical protein Dsin_018862 [Dipteronia sinensis]